MAPTPAEPTLVASRTTVDRDGRVLRSRLDGSLWLIFGGRRHHIASPEVLAALFRADLSISDESDVEALPLGSEVVEFSCLIQGEGDLAVYLFTDSDLYGLRRHLIPSFEDFQLFGFDLDKVRRVPRLVMEALPAGPDLVAAK